MLTEKQKSDARTVVKQVCSEYPEAFNVELARSKYPNYKPVVWNVDVTRRLLIPIIAKRVNTKLGSKIFGVVYRLDREDKDPKPGRLTSDVIAPFDKTDHFDVLSSSGAMWESHGLITDDKWNVEDADKHISFDTIKGGEIPNDTEAVPDESNDDYELIKKLRAELASASITITNQGKELVALKKPIVNYEQFVIKEAGEIAAKYLEKNEHEPNVHDMYHAAYRRLAEKWKHEDIIKDI